MSLVSAPTAANWPRVTLAVTPYPMRASAPPVSVSRSPQRREESPRRPSAQTMPEIRAAASGINAIEKMLTILPALLATLSSAPEQVNGVLREEILGAVTRTYTTIHGGTAPNVAPGSGEATLDFRLVPGQTVNGLLSDLQVQADRVRAAHPGTLIDIEPIPGSPRDPVVIPRDAPVIQALQRTYLRATGQPAAFGRGYSSGGLYHFHRLGVPAVYFGSGSIDHAHRENEFVNLEELTLMATLYAYLILDVCGPQAREQS